MKSFTCSLGADNSYPVFEANMSLEEMIHRFALGSSNQRDRNRLISQAESQGWRCCYCGVRMFAGHPLEDIFLYAHSMGMWPLMKGHPDLAVLGALSNLKASLEHLKGSWFGLPEVQRGYAAACRWCNSQRGGASAWHGGRVQPHPTKWYDITQRLIREGKHPHCQYISS